MTNEGLKKKITEIIGDVYLINAPIKDRYKPIFMEKIADALIAAGIGYVSEWKDKLKLHRVFVRKDSGDIKVLYGNKELDEIIKERDEYKHRAEVAERALLVLCDKVMRDMCVMVFPSTKAQVRNKQELYDYCIKQAEKELAGEKKDD